MTDQEMRTAFRVNYSQINRGKPKSFLKEEILIFLNWAYDTFVEQHVKPKRTNPENFTDIQQSLDSIRTLLKEDSTEGNLTLASTDGGRVSIQLPSDYLHLVDDASNTEVKCRLFNKVPNRLFSSDIVNTVLNNYLYKTDVRSPVSELVDNTLYVYKSNFSIANVYIKYIRKYNPISEGVNCDLPTFTHNKIVDLAVAKAKAVINANGYEKFVNESNKS